jgi:putative ABC transport system permease protein
MSNWSGGVRHIGRRLARTPLFTAVTLITLGVGIGATSAIFSVVYGVLLKPLPFVEPERLVGVWHRAPGLGFDVMNMSPATYFIYRENSRVFQDIGMWNDGNVTITGRAEPERVETLIVTDGTLPLLGVQPALGRLFTKDDDKPGVQQRALLSYGYWQRKFGGAPSVIGQQITVEGKPCEIIGVLPESFKFLRQHPAIVLPQQIDRAKVWIGNFSYQGVARLKPGVTLDEANRDVARMIPMLDGKFPLPPGFTKQQLDAVRLGPNVRPLSMDVIGDVGNVLWVLFGTVGIVLLIACANVANLFLVRSEGRQQELALRAALGASRGRIARELLTESVCLGIAGGLVGLVLANLAIGLLVRLAPDGLPRLDEIRIDPIVVVFTLAISIVSGLLFGMIPVFKFGTPSVAALKEGGRSTSEGPQRHRARSVLVVAEIAMALVLLIVSGLMIRTFVAMRQVDPGFVRPEQVQTFRIAIPDGLIKDDAQTVLAYRQIGERLRQVPGVTSVGLSSGITMDGFNSNDPIFVENITDPNGPLPPLRRFKWIAPGYFETMGNRVLYGRAISWTDIEQYQPVALVNERFAREYWKNPADAIGKRIRQSPRNPWREIVGVVGNERDNGLNAAAPFIVYWPMAMKEFWDEKTFLFRTMAYAVRSDRTGSPTLLRELQQAVWSVNSNLPLASVRTLDAIRGESMAQTSFALGMLAIAAGVALLLGVVGIYGIIAYIAAQRTREIGIRMALGAQAIDVSRLFLRHGLRLTGIGVVVGVVVALVLTRLMSALLFGVGPMDPATYVAVSVALGVVALIATYLPARRAARIDPIIALRSDV